MADSLVNITEPAWFPNVVMTIQKIVAYHSTHNYMSFLFISLISLVLASGGLALIITNLIKVNEEGK
jgi:hypothetical protein